MRQCRAAVLAVSVAALALLAACNGGEVRVPATVPTPPPATPEPTATPTPEPTPEAAWPVVTTATITTDNLNVRSGPGGQFVVVGQLQPGAEVPVAGQNPSGTWLGLPGIGWIAFNTEWMRLGQARDTLPIIPFDEAGYAFVGPTYPPGTESGLPVVDEVVRAIVSGDHATILRAVSTEEGDPATGGTRTPPGSSCPGEVLPASDLADHLDAFLTSEVSGSESGLQLFAVVGAPGSDTRDPEFVAILAFPRGEGRRVWVSPGGEGITWFSLGCEPTPPAELLRVTSGEPFFWLRPALPEPLTPVE
jgi:hypothetical protein